MLGEEKDGNNIRNNNNSNNGRNILLLQDREGWGIMELLIIIILSIILPTSIYTHLGKKQLEQERKFLERITYQTEEYKAAVKRLEELQKELGYSQKSKDDLDG